MPQALLKDMDNSPNTHKEKTSTAEEIVYLLGKSVS
jgi:hypothetical protein